MENFVKDHMKMNLVTATIGHKSFLTCGIYKSLKSKIMN